MHYLHLILLESFRKVFSYFLGQSISSTKININTKWTQYGKTIAGGNGKGIQLNQLDRPQGIYLDDDDQSIYIADG